LIAYLDASALVKLLVAEDGNELASNVWEAAAGRATSAATYPEVRAALAAAARDRRLTPRAHQRAVWELDRRVESIDVVELRRPLARVAGALAERHGLRGCDAVHLASALAIHAGQTVMVTWDRSLAKAAGVSGLGVIPST
jgi:hypothetical protein